MWGDDDEFEGSFFPREKEPHKPVRRRWRTTEQIYLTTNDAGSQQGPLSEELFDLLAGPPVAGRSGPRQ